MKTSEFQIRLSKEVSDLSNYKEHFFLTQNGQERKVLLHDYAEMYQNHGLYEYVCFQHLAYQAPQVLSSFLIEQLTKAQEEVSALKLLDIGAGSGLTAKALVALGVKSITGIDIYPEAAEAAKRESPNVYEEYYVEDLSQLDQETHQVLKNKIFNCLVCCSALPALPASVFIPAFNLIRLNAWIAFNVKKDIWEDHSSTGFVAQHPWVDNNEVFEIRAQLSYLRRYTTDGRPVEDVAIVGTKKGQIL